MKQAWDPESEHDYHADYPTRCWACTAVARRAEGYRESKHPQALRFGAEHRPRKRRTE